MGDVAQVPPEYAVEPERTERLLRRPFTFCHANPADAFQGRMGFLFFRVNGMTTFGVVYRLVMCALPCT